MNVRDMRMIVSERRMVVEMTVRLADRIAGRVVVLMMLVVVVEVVVGERLVGVLMAVSLTE